MLVRRALNAKTEAAVREKLPHMLRILEQQSPEPLSDGVLRAEETGQAQEEPDCDGAVERIQQVGFGPPAAEGARPDGQCQAEEWVRDGRGLWAMRVCRRAAGHGARHEFTSWYLNVNPPSTLALAARLDEIAREVEKAADELTWCEHAREIGTRLRALVATRGEEGQG
jgi:hypothetical protein